MAFSFEITGSQIDGARDYQEDAFLITHLGDTKEGGSLVVVADGMGGHAAGNVASNMAVQALNKHVTANYPHEHLDEVLHESAVKANEAIRETVQETAALKGMGCTLVCAILEENLLRWVSVGDSHLYILREHQLQKKNADHSYGGFLDRMAAEGKEVEEEAGFSRNMLMSALTGDDIADVDCPQTPFELQAGDRILICSDGLDTLKSERIIEICSAAASPKECVEALLQAVTDENIPRQDNTTVVVVEVSEKVEPITAPTPEPLDEETSPPLDTARPESAPFQGGETPGKAGVILGVLAAIILVGGAAFYIWSSGMLVGKPATPITTPPLPAPEPPISGPDTEPEPVVTEEPPGPAPEPTPELEPVVMPTTPPFTDALRGGSRGPEMILLPGGTFTMGSKSAAEFDERPEHVVKVPSFAISRYEVTLAEYLRFARATGRGAPKNAAKTKPNHPVVFVTWQDANAYTKWLSNETGKTYRLPSEAEWEYAARGGSEDRYPWGRTIGKENAHCIGCGSTFNSRTTAPVGSFKPNAFGVYDTAGNAAEWVADCPHDSYQGAPTDGSVFSGGTCDYRVVRGGSFISTPKSVRSNKRDRFRPDRANDNIGLRVVRTP